MLQNKENHTSVIRVDVTNKIIHVERTFFVHKNSDNSDNAAPVVSGNATSIGKGVDSIMPHQLMQFRRKKFA